MADRRTTVFPDIPLSPALSHDHSELCGSLQECDAACRSGGAGRVRGAAAALSAREAGRGRPGARRAGAGGGGGRGGAGGSAEAAGAGGGRAGPGGAPRGGEGGGGSGRGGPPATAT